MIHLNFLVAPKVLAFDAAGAFDGENSGVSANVTALHQEALRLDADSCAILFDNFLDHSNFMTDALERKSLSHKFGTIDQLLSTLTASSQFQPLQRSALEDMSALREAWEQSLTKSWSQDLMDFLSDGRDKFGLRVFVNPSALPFNRISDGDIYITTSSRSNSLVQLWQSISDCALTTETQGADEAWIENLIKELCAQEITCRIEGAAFPDTISKKSERERVFIRDYEWLVPSWKEYMKASEPKRYATYRAQATAFLTKKWNERKSTQPK